VLLAGWKQKAVAEVQKSVVQHWIHSMREEEVHKFSCSKILADTKNAFVTPPPSSDLPCAPDGPLNTSTSSSWLTQVTAKAAQKVELESEKPENVAVMLFAEILRRAGLTEKGAIDRKELASTMKALGFETGVVERLVSQVASASRSRKSIAELNLVSQHDFVPALCLDHFWKLRDIATRKQVAWRAADEANASLSAPSQSRYSGYAGVGAFLMTSGAVDRGVSSEGLGSQGYHESTFDSLKTPTLKTINHPKDANLYMRAWGDDGGAGGKHDGAHDDSLGVLARRPLSALSVGRPASALSLTHFSRGRTASHDTDLSSTHNTCATATPMLSPQPHPSTRSSFATATPMLSPHPSSTRSSFTTVTPHPSSTRSSFATATPMLSKRLGLNMSVFLDDDAPVTGGGVLVACDAERGRECAWGGSWGEGGGGGGGGEGHYKGPRSIFLESNGCIYGECLVCDPVYGQYLPPGLLQINATLWYSVVYSGQNVDLRIALCLYKTTFGMQILVVLVNSRHKFTGVSSVECFPRCSHV